MSAQQAFCRSVTAGRAALGGLLEADLTKFLDRARLWQARQILQSWRPVAPNSGPLLACSSGELPSAAIKGSQARIARFHLCSSSPTSAQADFTCNPAQPQLHVRLLVWCSNHSPA